MGQTLAKMAVVSHMAHLVSHFHFRIAEELVGPPAQVEADQMSSLTVSPGKGMWMYAEPRWI